MDASFTASLNAATFWETTKSVAKKAGKEIIEKALVLWYVLEDPETPTSELSLRRRDDIICRYTRLSFLSRRDNHDYQRVAQAVSR